MGKARTKSTGKALVTRSSYDGGATRSWLYPSHVTNGDSVLNKQQRKKVRRKEQKQSERQAHRNLDAITGEAIEMALKIVSGVATTHNAAVLDVDLASVSEAQFVRKRVNDALQIAEWLDEVQVVLWQLDEHWSAPLSTQGETDGFELRIERARRDPVH